MLMGSAPAAAKARQHAAVVVTPDCRGIGLLEFHQIDRAIDAGRVAGRAAVEALAPASLATDSTRFSLARSRRTPRCDAAERPFRG